MTPDTLHSDLTAVVDYLLDNGITRGQALDDFERKLIERALFQTHGNETAAARKLGIHRNTVANRRKNLLGETREQMRRRNRRRR